MLQTNKTAICSIFTLAFIAVFFLSACNIEKLDELLEEKYYPPGSLNKEGDYRTGQGEKSDYYNKFFEDIAKNRVISSGTISNVTMDNLPKGLGGEVNWTAAVIEGYIDPKGSLDPDAEEMAPLDLNIFIEAKVPLMANVLFPHSIHTYWLNCATCHPQIFIPKAGANPISMNEIFEGKWCGRCHGKVAFKFYPIGNCRRCHIIMKNQSLEKEHFR
jgi:c(7)-type cytochrome triheme protein